MPKKCSLCGMIKKTTFNCRKCKKRVCLNCFNFLDGMCYDCVNDDYNEKYKDRIEKYHNALSILDIPDRFE